MSYLDTYKRVRRSVNEGRLESLYILEGSDRFLLETFWRTLAKAFKDKYPAGELKQKWGADFRDPADFHELLEGGGLFNTPSLVFFHHAESAATAVKKAMAPALERQPDNTCMLIHYEVARRKPVWASKLAEQGRHLMIAAPFPTEAATIVKALATERGFQIENAAVNRLLELAGGDLAIVEQDLEKMSLFLDGRERRIQVEDVDQISGLTEQANVDTLRDAIGRRNRGAALRALQEIVHQGNEGWPFVVVVIHSHLSRLLLVKEGATSGGPRMAGMSPFVRNELDKVKNNYSREELEAGIQSLAEIDLNMRLGRSDMLACFAEWIAKVL